MVVLLLLLSSYVSADTVTSVKNAQKLISTDKVVHLSGEVNGLSLSNFEREYYNTIAKPGVLLIIINSPGGSMHQGNKMIELVEYSKASGTKVVCVANVDASSMAFNLLSHCDVRLSTLKTRMVVHKLADYFTGDYLKERLTAKRLRYYADILDRDDEPYRQLNSKLMHLSLIEYDLYADQDRNWTALELYQSGYIQDIVILESPNT